MYDRTARRQNITEDTTRSLFELRIIRGVGTDSRWRGGVVIAMGMGFTILYFKCIPSRLKTKEAVNFQGCISKHRNRG